ncbi:MAG: methyltransferase [Oscillospiraceae bacterium]|jgi:regulator of RNase E activity RraA|nr:methyltransferase [Oscillospiraceae bacterium]
MISIGNRIFTKVERPDPKIIEMFKGLPTSNINDEINRLFCMHDYIRPLNDIPLLGTAITVKAPIGDNLFFHQALDMAQPGDVIVVDGGSGCNRSLAGEIMIRFAAKKGLAGIVVDGCLRDLDGIRALPIAVYAKGITPQGPFKFGPGEINTPIACGGQVVFPGDILVGDADGIVVIHRQDAEAVAEVAIKKKASEDKTFELMESDFAAYTAKHLSTTEKRFSSAGQQIPKFGSYSEMYNL